MAFRRRESVHVSEKEVNLVSGSERVIVNLTYLSCSVIICGVSLLSACFYVFGG